MRSLVGCFILLSCLGSASVSAGEVGVLSDSRVKVSVDGRVLGIFAPGRLIPVKDLADGFHKVLVHSLDSGETRTFKAPMPFLDGQRFVAHFGGRDATDSPPPLLAPASQADSSVDVATPKDVRDLVELQELSQGLVEGLAEDVASLRQEVRELRTTGPEGFDEAALLAEEETPTSRSGRAKLYGYVDGEYSDSDQVNDHGSFDIHHVYIGVMGEVAPRWDGRLELELAHGFSSSNGSTLGAAKMERAFVTHHGDFMDSTFGKIFSPFGFWAPIHQAVFKVTTQDPLMFRGAYASGHTGITLRKNLERGAGIATIGLYNGEGAAPDETDDNDNKSLILGWETRNFLNGRLGVFFNRQKDGNQGDRSERKWIFSLEQKWRRFNLLSEYFHEEAFPVAGIGGGDGFYSDLRYSFTEDLSMTYRWDSLDHDLRVGGGSRIRNLVNFHYAVSPTLRVKADWYRDNFQDPARLSTNGIELAIASAIGL